MRLEGTPMAFASWFWLMPISPRNSAFRISPGWGLCSSAMLLLLSVIVRDFDIAGFAIIPSKTDTPLIVYPDAPLAFAIAFEGLQTVAWRVAQVVQRKGSIQLAQLAQGPILNISGKLSAMLTMPYPLRLLVFKASDHSLPIAWY